MIGGLELDLNLFRPGFLDLDGEPGLGDRVDSRTPEMASRTISASPIGGRSGTDSTGLGLDIARRTAVAAGGELLLRSSALGGAEVTMRLLLVGGR